MSVDANPLSGKKTKIRMSRSIHYGLDSECQVDIPDESVVADCAWQEAVPVDDPAAVVAVALDNPLDFPPLHQAIVPGDRVAVALSPHVPQADAVAGGVVQSLLQTGVELDGIQIVVSGRMPQETLARIEACVPQGVEIVVHDSTNRQSLAFLTSSRHGNAIYVNRALHDADVVLPIGSVRLDSARGTFEVGDDVFPTFSDEETLQRFARARDNSSELRGLAEEVAEATWLLGVHLTVQVVPGAGNSVLHVLAGETKTVAERSGALCNEAWRVDLNRRASLVIASLPGGVEEQTWDNFSRALRNASRAVADEGAIVLCTEISVGEIPVSDEEPAYVEHRGDEANGHSTQTVSAPPTSVIEEIRERHNVYLLSRLEEDYVEELGMGYVARADQISRLVRQHDSCILLGNAQHVFVKCGSE